jgi:hypothetical protein
MLKEYVTSLARMLDYLLFSSLAYTLGWNQASAIKDVSNHQHRHVLPVEPSHKIRSFLVIVFFRFYNVCNFMWQYMQLPSCFPGRCPNPFLSTAPVSARFSPKTTISCVVYLLSKTSISKVADGRTSNTGIPKAKPHLTYRTQRHHAQTCTSSLFSAVNKDTQRIWVRNLQARISVKDNHRLRRNGAIGAPSLQAVQPRLFSRRTLDSARRERPVVRVIRGEQY